MKRNLGRKGQGLVEYALLIGLIAVVAIGVLSALGQDSIGGTLYGQINTALQSVLSIVH